jgi:hypothetical protein
MHPVHPACLQGDQNVANVPREAFTPWAEFFARALVVIHQQNLFYL